MSDTVLVTGGTGFIAQRCIVELLRQGYSGTLTQPVRPTISECEIARRTWLPVLDRHTDQVLFALIVPVLINGLTLIDALVHVIVNFSAASVVKS